MSTIDKFVWRLCVNHRTLNTITKTFPFLIPRCSDSVEDFGVLYGVIFYIKLNNRQGYHQIQVKKIDQEKIVFFTPDGGKKQIVMMPFRPKNAPNVYTAMMKNPETYGIYYLIKTSPRSI